MSDVIHALHEETIAATSLLESLRTLIGDDEDMQATAVEGETNLHEAINNAMTRLAELNGLMNGIAGMMADLKDRGERLERQRDNIRTAIAVAMEAAGMKRHEGPLATLTLKAVPPKVEIVDEADIPAAFWKPQDPKLDKAGLLKALKDGQQITGATLSNGGVTLQVKMS